MLGSNSPLMNGWWNVEAQMASWVVFCSKKSVLEKGECGHNGCTRWITL
jgi:hypothetical protein